MQHESNIQIIIGYGQGETYGEITEIRSGGGFNGAFWKVPGARLPKWAVAPCTTWVSIR